MATKTFMKECKSCKKPTMHLQQVDSSVPHLIGTIITFGLWLPFWLMRAAGTGMRSPAQCTVCGQNWQNKMWKDIKEGTAEA